MCWMWKKGITTDRQVVDLSNWMMTAYAKTEKWGVEMKNLAVAM